MSLNKEKVLWISAYGPESLESAANRLRKLSNGLKNGDVEVSWIYPKDSHSKLGSIFFLIIDCFKWLKKNHEGVVICSLPPSWLLLVALFPAFFYPNRLALDFRDPLVNPRLIRRSFIMDFFIGALQNYIVKRCKKVILSSPAIASFLPPVEKEKFVTVFSGFDPRDVSVANKTNDKRDKIVFVYGGTFYGTRSPLPFLKALKKFKDSLKTELIFQFKFFSKFNDLVIQNDCTQFIHENYLAEDIFLEPLVSKDKFDAEMTKSDVLVAITHAEGSEYAIPGKIFDYISAQKPIFLISTDPVLKNMMADAGLVFFQATNDEKDILRALNEIYTSRNEITRLQPYSEKLNRLSSLHQGLVLKNNLFEKLLEST